MPTDVSLEKGFVRKMGGYGKHFYEYFIRIVQDIK